MINESSPYPSPFIYSKQHYIDITLTLPYMLFESLLICPCQDTYNDMFWDHFDCSRPFTQVGSTCCSMSKKVKCINFRTFNELLKHTNSREKKCNQSLSVLIIGKSSASWNKNPYKNVIRLRKKALTLIIVDKCLILQVINQ